MKYLVVGDPHYKRTNHKETEALEREVDRLIQETRPDEIVILGDTLDRFHIASLCRATRWLQRLRDVLPVTLLIGNHDRRDNTDSQSDVHPFPGLERTHQVVSKVTRRGDCLFVPYVPNNTFYDTIAKIDMSEIKLIFCHQSFVGSCDPLVTETWNGPPIISGHIHDRRVIYRGEPSSLDRPWNLYYPGAPLCNNFGDAWDRFCCTVDDELTVVEYAIEVPLRYTIDVASEIDSVTLDLINLADEYARIDIRGTFLDCQSLKIKKEIEEARKRGAQIRTLYTDTVASLPVCEKRSSYLETLMSSLAEEIGSSGVEVIRSVLQS